MSEGESYQVAVLIAAAGSGRRMGAGRSKGLLTLAGRPLLLWAISPFLHSGLVECLIVVARAEEIDVICEILDSGLSPTIPVIVVPGGEERADSVRAGLERLASWNGWRPEARHMVAIHDAARPLLTTELWQRVLLAALRSGAAIPGLPAVDSLKAVADDGWIKASVDRSGIWQVQTPQVFVLEEILDAHCRARAAGCQPTDDAQVMELAGRPVQVVQGERDNIKVTTKTDLILAELILRGRSDGDAGGNGL